MLCQRDSGKSFSLLFVKINFLLNELFFKREKQIKHEPKIWRIVYFKELVFYFEFPSLRNVLH